MSDLRKQIAFAISDPGHAGEGYKGERTLSEWQVDAVMTIVDRLEKERDYAVRWANKAVDDVKASFAGALWDIRAERQRQVDEEGWTAEHDDQHNRGEIALAAAAYAEHTVASDRFRKQYSSPPVYWPWSDKWWKPTDRRRDLVKAGALIVAEIERLDRAAAIRKGEAV